jgi:hypothetical protein
MSANDPKRTSAGVTLHPFYRRSGPATGQRYHPPRLEIRYRLLAAKPRSSVLWRMRAVIVKSSSAAYGYLESAVLA